MPPGRAVEFGAAGMLMATEVPGPGSPQMFASFATATTQVICWVVVPVVPKRASVHDPATYAVDSDARDMPSPGLLPAMVPNANVVLAVNVAWANRTSVRASANRKVIWSV